MTDDERKMVTECVKEAMGPNGFFLLTSDILGALTLRVGDAERAADLFAEWQRDQAAALAKFSQH
jgi:hypothetical protein